MLITSIQGVPNYIKKIYYLIINSISFYPVVISTFFLILAHLAIKVGLSKFKLFSKLDLEFLTKIDSEIAQTIASAIIGGVFSLTVFSFSMVMVVLSQASSNFSPRLLPGLISDKKHQLILGFYTGTLIYAFILLINIGILSTRENDLGFAALMAAIFGICCVVLFVVFIHGISQAIQIDNIINNLHLKIQKQLNHCIDHQEAHHHENHSMETVVSNCSGYYRSFNSKFSEKFIDNNPIQIEIVPYVDKYVWKGDPLFRITKNVNNNLKNNVADSFNLSANKNSSKEYLSGMIKLMEVAVKAMSPGINDPSTAIDAITKLTEAMRTALKIYPTVCINTSNEAIQLVQNNISASDLIRILIQPIHHYAQDDFAVLCALVESLNSLDGDHLIPENAKSLITQQLEALRKSIVALGNHKRNKAHFEKLFADA